MSSTSGDIISVSATAYQLHPTRGSMGSIHLPPLADLATALIAAEGIRDFVETGTYLGHALGWASRRFDRVWTIEINTGFQAEAKASNAALSNVYYSLGDSIHELPKIIAQLPSPALFWLDAHAGAGFFADEDICPLIAEIDTILAAREEHCMIIDDARAFLAPPPPPFDYRKWPTLEQIFGTVAKRPGLHIVSIADTLIIVPERLRPLVAQFCFAIRPTI
jgi:hypothetical protein